MSTPNPTPHPPLRPPRAEAVTACRSCGGALSLELVDLGAQPLANGYLTEAALARPEPRYPLRAVVCDDCRLVQLDHGVPPAMLFSDYAYLSSTSSSWLAHAQRFAEAAIPRFGLGPESLVVEVASNDGYLLRHFGERGVPVLGIEPAANVAATARALGIPTEVRFFDRACAEALRAEGRRADLLVANNVLAHVPDINGFVAGLSRLLAPEGRLSLEFPHLLRLLEQVQFDTIYHEHVFYYSLLSAERLLARHGLTVIDVEQLPTHGGSLRLWAGHRDVSVDAVMPAVAELRAEEAAAGLAGTAVYRAFADAVPALIESLLAVLREARGQGQRIVGLGAAAKGNVLLNAAAIGPALIDCLLDASPTKQGRFAPGSRLPILPPERLTELRPDLVVILPWNLEAELIAKHRAVFDWGGRFLVPIPAPRLVRAPA